MPWFEIPPEKLPHLSLFGYDRLSDGTSASDFEWYTGPLGRTRVQKSKPFVWLEDVADGIQLGAVGIHKGPSDA